MTTDKALAVMSEEHLGLIRGQLIPADANVKHFLKDAKASKRAKDAAGIMKLYARRLREIESVVRYLVDHPERLAGEDEVAWLIEDSDPDWRQPNWWAGGSRFSTDPNAAVRFARKLDAERTLASIPTTGRLIATEHMWLAGSPTAQPDSPVLATEGETDGMD